MMLKKNVAKCLAKNKMDTVSAELFTLKEFYAGKFLVYEKYDNQNSNYFATFLLNLSSVNKER